MTQMVINIPTLNDDDGAFKKLFEIWSQVCGHGQQVLFEFSRCHFLRPNALAFLGGLTRLIEFRMGTVIFDWNTLSDLHVKNTLIQNGFAGAFGLYSTGRTGHSIPYREDSVWDANSIIDYLEHYWLGRGWVHVSSRLRDAIVGRVWEIYNNAFEHSQSEIGVFSCGQHFYKKTDLILSVVDFGQGIPAKVRAFLSRDPRASQLTAAGCLRWAFQRGNTTKEDEPGGLGLDLLKEFIRINQGKLEVYSNEGYAIINNDGERYENRDIGFEGTMMHITLRCDEKLYRFADET
jgi:hypothetical protein